jgi:DNA-binding beta-propeller fold protein YncE
MAAVTAFCSWAAVPVHADFADVLATYNFNAANFALHPTQHLLYASLPALNSVAIINTDTLALVNTVPIGPKPRGLALSPDGSRLYVATMGAAALGVMDTATMTALPSIGLPNNPAQVAAGNGGRVYATPAVADGGIMQVDGIAGSYTNEFDFSVSVYSSGLLQISPDRNTLYFANTGLSPGTLAKFDVSSASPSFLMENPHGSLGSNGQDLALSHNGAFISYACGGGNGAIGYEIFKLSSETFSSFGGFNTGAYPREIIYSPDDAIAYTVHDAGKIDVFDATTFAAGPFIPTVGEAGELFTDHTGRYLFAAFSNQLRVYDTGRTPEPTTLALLAVGMGAVLRRSR